MVLALSPHTPLLMYKLKRGCDVIVKYNLKLARIGSLNYNTVEQPEVKMREGCRLSRSTGGFVSIHLHADPKSYDATSRRFSWYGSW